MYIICYNIFPPNIIEEIQEEKPIVFIHIFAYCILYSFLLFQDSFLYNFTSVYRASFRHYFRIGLPVTNFLSFPSTENVSISP